MKFRHLKATRLLLLFTVIITSALASESSYLVIGTRGLAYTVTAKLLDAGNKVTVLAYKTDGIAKLHGDNENLTLVKGAAEKDTELLKKTVEGKKYVFFCPHYPYDVWAKLMPQATTNVINAVRDATIIFPSKSYAAGKSDNPMTEKTAGLPCSDQGKVLKEVEDRLTSAAQAGTCKAIIVRHSSVYGPRIVDGLIDRAFKNALNKQPMQWIYQVSTPYQVSYSEDIARTMIALCQDEQRDDAVLYHFAGTTLESVENWLKTIHLAAGNDEDNFSTELDGWFKVKMLAAFQTDAQACKDIFYSFENPVLLDDSKLKKDYPEVKTTNMAEAINETLASFKK